MRVFNLEKNLQEAEIVWANALKSDLIEKAGIEKTDEGFDVFIVFNNGEVINNKTEKYLFYEELNGCFYVLYNDIMQCILRVG